MKQNSAHNAVFTPRLKPIAMILILLAMAFAISINFMPKASYNSPQDNISIPYNHSGKPKQSGTYTHVLGYTFSDRDLLIYKQLYKAQGDGNWNAADALLSELRDDILLGAVLAQRYLHKDYTSSFAELVSWLKNYGDMPTAPRILALARSKQPANTTLPNITAKAKRLKGVGVRDGLGGETMPAAWRAGLDAWEEGEYHTAASIFSMVANQSNISPWHQSAGHFWAYRANKRAGYKKKAANHLRQAANAPFTLYGTLARHALNSKETLKADLPTLTRDILNVSAVKRAAAYSAIGQDEKADLELRHYYKQSTLAHKKQLITIAAALDMPALQLRMSQMIYKKAHGSNAAAYPMPRWIPNYDMMVDPALVFAIARQESGFYEKAKSPAGARGVMQVMPKTADYVIKRFKLNEVKLASVDLSELSVASISAKQMHNPQINMTVAQHYIHYLSDKPYINGDVIRLLAAYNAGPANVIEWNKRFSEIDDPLLFIERIPFRETRHYVKQVMSNYVVYSELMHANSRESFALIRGQWPQMSDTAFRSASLHNRKLASAK